jgi:large subunit ribosomal protein L19
VPIFVIVNTKDYGIILFRRHLLAANLWGDDVMNLVESLERQMAKPNPNIPVLSPGDTVRVYVRIVEGDRERVQPFQGTLIRMHKGSVNANFTVRRIASHGVGVERTFLLHSPRLEKVEVLRHAKVRRAQLYYLRNLRGKAARLKERR